MENPLVQIKNSLFLLLKDMDPDVDIFFEEIKGTDESHGLDMPKTYYFVEIIPSINDTVDRYFTDMGVMVDVAYHDEKESNTTYLAKTAELDGIIRPVFSFGNRNITVSSAAGRVVDHVLHFSFSLSFRQAREVTSKYQKMGELDVTVKEGE